MDMKRNSLTKSAHHLQLKQESFIHGSRSMITMMTSKRSEPTLRMLTDHSTANELVIFIKCCYLPFCQSKDRIL